MLTLRCSLLCLWGSFFFFFLVRPAPGVFIRLRSAFFPAVFAVVFFAPAVAAASLVVGREICARSSSAAGLFMKSGICGFDKKPRDAAANRANGDKTPPPSTNQKASQGNVGMQTLGLRRTGDEPRDVLLMDGWTAKRRLGWFLR